MQSPASEFMNDLFNVPENVFEEGHQTTVSAMSQIVKIPEA